MRGKVEQLPVAALQVAAGDLVVAVNVAAEQLLGRPAADLCGQPLAQLRARFPAGLQEGAISLGRGTRLLFLAGVDAPHPLQQQIYHLSRLASVGRLVSTVVHEINNALSGIVGYSQLLLERDLGDARADVERVHEEALRTSRVVKNLLQFSRQGTGERRPLALPELIQRCAEMKRRDFALKSIDFHLQAPAQVPEVAGDDALLSQVFINLLTNAEQSIHACRDRGNVRVRLRRSGAWLLVDVSDDGPGIPATRREQIFQPFFTARPDGTGTGLGLALCREILNEHGGDIQLLGRGPPGACFRLRLPVAAPARRHPSVPRPGPGRTVLRNRRIVVVEDEVSQRELIARAFHGHGNRIVTFERGEDALAYLLHEPVDLVISDIHRPGLDGMALYQQLARQRGELTRRFLFVTGDTVSQEIQHFLAHTEALVLRKPLLLEDLTARAVELLARPSSQGELFA